MPTSTPFLEMVAKNIASKSNHQKAFTIVFPNKRSIVYFQHHIKKYIHIPQNTLQLFSIEQFVVHISNITLANNIWLLKILFFCFKQQKNQFMSFDQFIPWGNILLNDFNMLAQYFLDSNWLSKYLDNMHKQPLYMLSEEEKKALVHLNFTSQKNKYAPSLWKILPHVYQKFQHILYQKKKGYLGLCYQKICAILNKNNKPKNINQHTAFVGFNALTPVEEQIFLWYKNNTNSIFFWDTDIYYMHNTIQEAGLFLRKYQQKKYFSASFQHIQQHNLLHTNPNIALYGTSSDVEQIQWMCSALQMFYKENIARSIAIVLLDKSLYLPLLYALPQHKNIVYNFTMGFPFIKTVLYSFLLQIIQLHICKQEQDIIPWENVKSIFKNPYIYTICSEEYVNNILSNFSKKNTQKMWFKNHTLLQNMVTMYKDSQAYILMLLHHIKNNNKKITHIILEKEKKILPLCIKHIEQLYSHIKIFKLSAKAYYTVLQHVAKSIHIPQKNINQKSIQIMGILETRNLDFDYIFFLGMNENNYPPPNKLTSFIPNSIKNQHKLLHHTTQRNAIYAYYFYRLLQRTKKVWITYNTQIAQKGSLTRYIKQINYETSWIKKKYTITSPKINSTAKKISIQDKKDINKIQYITPTAINTYLDCKLKFYFKYILQINNNITIGKQNEQVILGQFLHLVLAKIYPKNSLPLTVTQETIQQIQKNLDQTIIQVSKQLFQKMDTKNKIFIQALVKKMVEKILTQDSKKTPFIVHYVEKNIKFSWSIPHATQKIILSGIIDRVDEKDDIIRIIDYKTGDINLQVESISSLFESTHSKRNSTALQLLFYAWLYQKNTNIQGKIVMPYIINTRKIFFTTDQNHLILKQVDKKYKEKITQITNIIPIWEKYLYRTLKAIFDPNIPFNQTENINICSYCPYQQICQRHSNKS